MYFYLLDIHTFTPHPMSMQDYLRTIHAHTLNLSCVKCADTNLIIILNNVMIIMRNPLLNVSICESMIHFNMNVDNKY